MMDARDHIKRETRLSITINVVLSLAFFQLVFGFSGMVKVWDVGAYAIDFLTQSLMIALMSTLVPVSLIAKKLATNEVKPIEKAPLLRMPLWYRAINQAVYDGALALVVTPVGAQ